MFPYSEISLRQKILNAKFPKANFPTAKTPRAKFLVTGEDTARADERTGGSIIVAEDLF